MPTDTKLKELIINELTEEQYKALTPNDDELYLTPDGSITKNENGSYVLDGDVDITGTTKLSGGIKPIHTYPLGNYTFEVLFERHLPEATEHTFFGYIIYDDGTSVPCIGSYSIIEGAITSFSAISYETIYSFNAGGAVVEKAIATK